MADTTKSDHLETSTCSTSNGPPCLIVLGMAGSGKSSFVQVVFSVSEQFAHSFIHFDLATDQPFAHHKVVPIPCQPWSCSRSVRSKRKDSSSLGIVPFPANIDIRDTVKYKAVMQEYGRSYRSIFEFNIWTGLGPNGAILTSLNLFCTRFNQVHPSFSYFLQPLSFPLFGGARLATETKGHSALCDLWHARPDRGVHLVSQWRHHHRITGRFTSDSA